jgi:AraC-like DNA-binding protein
MDRKSLDENRRKLVELLLQLTTGEGMRRTILDQVKFTRADRYYPRESVMYEPSIVIVVSGRKRGYVGTQTIIYDPQQYLVLSVPLPFECETEIGDQGKMLAISVRIEMSMLSELALKINLKERPPIPEGSQTVSSVPLELEILQIAVRLLECMRSSKDAVILGPHIIRELVYRVLCGPQGGALLALLARNGFMARVLEVLERIHAHYDEPLDVAGMAEQAGMSAAVFHRNFKLVTAFSPAQYLKNVRLHKARLAMIHDGLKPAAAAKQVGYESRSQFSREFKRYFGASPTEELARINAILKGTDLKEVVMI